MEPPQIVLVQDTREQNGFGPWFESEWVSGTLTYGDYSVLGLEHLISIERKSLADFLGSSTQSRDRFELELKRARCMHRFFVIVEAKWEELLRPDFGSRSMANPKAMWGTVMAWSHRYHPFIFAGGREVAAKLTEGILVSYAKESWKQQDGIRKAVKRKGYGRGRKRRGQDGTGQERMKERSGVERTGQEGTGTDGGKERRG